MNNTLIWLVMVLSAATPVMAQNTETSESKNTKGRRAWFVQTGLPEGLENPVKVMTGEVVELVTLSNRLASGPIKIPSGGIIRLVQEVPDKENPGKSRYQTLAQANVPEQTNQALIILVPTPKKEGSDLLFETKVQGLTDFQGGDCLYINMTNLNVGVEIGQTKIPLKPGTSKIYDGEAYAQATNVPYRYSYFQPEKKSWKVLSASLAIMSGVRREIWIFSVDGATDQVRCRGVTFPVSP